jgi:cytosine/adenosine deaminase-related metal-dependent hydrolase
MSILLKNATYIDWESLEFTHADILVEEGIDGGIRLVQPGETIELPAVQETLDCSGKLVTKAFAIGHHHVYSALARGMPPPKYHISNFREKLKYVWWTLDKCLDEDMIYYSALVTAMAAAKAGSTFVIDHHASPNHIEGSLGIIAEAFEKVGVGHLLCYEVTDRDGAKGSRKGLDETVRYLKKKQGLVGLHASFTVSDSTLARVASLMKKYKAGVHVHVAEDLYDQEHCLMNYGKRVMKRWYDAGLLNSPKTILVHGLHLDMVERELFRNNLCWMVQNMESNLNNNVGHFNSEGLGDRIMLGTDGMHSDMLQSAKAAFFAGKAFDNISFKSTYLRFRNVHRYLSTNGFTGDGSNNLVVLDYDSPTGINQNNFTGHFLFGINACHVRDVLSDGKIIVKNRNMLTLDQEAILEEARIQASRLWERMSV